MKKQPKLNILLARMAYDGYESSKLVNWLIAQSVWLASNPAIDNVYHVEVVRKSPVARARNLAAKAAIDSGSDILVMVDHDIIPSPDWLPTAISLIQEARAEGRTAIVAAPAICEDSRTNVGIYKSPVMPQGFQWVGVPQLHRFGVQEASQFGGVGYAAACGTGAIAIDCDAFSRLPQPWFALEYSGEDELEISTGEDIYFTRNAGHAGIAINVTWDEWAVHKKELDLARPDPIDPFTIPAQYRELVGMLAASEVGPPAEGEGERQSS